MRFSWNASKNAGNYRKHGVSFETARLVFDDPFHISRQDRIEDGEVRWQTIGMVDGMPLLLVAHLWEDDFGEDRIRIISARQATKVERKAYEQGS